MRTPLRIILVVTIFVTGALATELPSKKALNLASAKQISAAAEAEALKNNVNVVIAILDDGGNLLNFERHRNSRPTARCDLQAAHQELRGSAGERTPRHPKTFRGISF
jgi:hypothetical protein